MLPKILARFADANPQVEVTVRCDGSQALEAALTAGELDLAVMVCDDGTAAGGLLFHDPTVWVTSQRHLTHEREPLPLALFEPGCWWRDWALAYVQDQGRPYRVAYTSASVTGVQAAIAAGLGVGVLGRSTVPDGLQVLGSEDGYADLPGSNVVLRMRSTAAREPSS